MQGAGTKLYIANTDRLCSSFGTVIAPTFKSNSAEKGDHDD